MIEGIIAGVVAILGLIGVAFVRGGKAKETKMEKDAYEADISRARDIERKADAARGNNGDDVDDRLFKSGGFRD